MEQDFERMARDVCNIFKEVTGKQLDPKREMVAIVKFMRDHKWKAFDFRLIIEHDFADPVQREYLSKPGRMNLRTILNPARESILLDIYEDLKNAKEMQMKQKEAADIAPDVKTNDLSMSGGRIFQQRFSKVLDKSVPKGYRWKWMNREEYEAAVAN